MELTCISRMLNRLCARGCCYGEVCPHKGCSTAQSPLHCTKPSFSMDGRGIRKSTWMTGSSYKASRTIAIVANEPGKRKTGKQLKCRSYTDNKYYIYLLIIVYHLQTEYCIIDLKQLMKKVCSLRVTHKTL